jgi:hypothetical protein
MRNAVLRFCDSPNAAPYLASLGNEVVIGIDHQECSNVLVIRVFGHGVSSRWSGWFVENSIIAGEFLSAACSMLAARKGVSL